MMKNCSKDGLKELTKVIEICCEPNSTLGKVENMRDHTLVVRMTKDADFIAFGIAASRRPGLRARGRMAQKATRRNLV